MRQTISSHGVLSEPGRVLASGLLLGCLWLGPAGAEIVLTDQKSDGDGKERPELNVPPPSGAAQPDRFDVLEFLSGDRIRGTFYTIEEAVGVRWRHPAIRQVLEIDPAQIASIRLDRPQTTNSPPGQTCLVRLTNEDELLAELISIDATNISLRTWYGGLLSIPRNTAASLAPGQTPNSALYQGPEGLEGWKQGKTSRVRQAGPGRAEPQGWAFRNGAFYCAGGGSIGRDVQLPALSSIEFDMAWNGYLQLGFAFYSDNLENYGGNCYLVQFSSGSVYLQRMTKEGNSSNLGHSEASMLAQQSKARIAIRSNKDQKNISLFINGDLVKQWTDRGDFSPGTGLAFFHQGQGVSRISNIRVTEWNGKLDQETQPDGPSKEDLVKLGNNDQISGTLKSVQEGTMSFATEFATLEVPLNRIAEIRLATEQAQTAEPQPTDVRAVFAHRGSLTLHLERWDDTQISGTHPYFGQFKFIPSAFSRIDFNLDQQRSDPDLLDLSGFETGGPVFFDQ